MDNEKQGTLSDQEILKELKDHAGTLLENPDAWMSMADTLRRASDILDREFKMAQNAVTDLSYRKSVGEKIDENALYEANKNVLLFRVSQMLFQMSIENSLKGIAVAQGKEPKPIHDLAILAREVGIELDKEEEGRLAVLTRMNQLGRFRVGGSEKKGYTHGAVSFNNLEKLYFSVTRKIKMKWETLLAQKSQKSV